MPFSERIRQDTGLHTWAVGMITEPQQADDIIASGKADMVALARAMMADPRWAWHAANSLGVDTPWSKMYLRAHPRYQGQFFPRHDGQPIR